MDSSYLFVMAYFLLCFLSYICRILMKIHKIICFFLLFLLLLNKAKAQTDINSDYNERLFEDSIQNIHIMDGQLGAYRVFFNGENHLYSEVNANLEFQMLKYLNQSAGVKNLLLELGYARGYILDKYINEDSTYFDLLSNVTSYTYNAFFKELRKYNLSLPDSMRIHVQGVDIERFPKESFVLLADLLPPDSLDVPKEIDFLVEVFRVYGNYSKKANVEFYNYYSFLPPENYFLENRTLDSLVLQFESHRNYFETYLGANFELYSFVMESLKEHRIYKSYEGMPHQAVFRERILKRNIDQLLKSDGTQKYFGQFGRCHMDKNNKDDDCNWYGQKSVAKRLTESGYKDQILPILIYYDKNFHYNYYDYYDFYKPAFPYSQHIKSQYADSINELGNTIVKVKDNDTMLNGICQYIILNICCERNYFNGKKLKSFYASFDIKGNRVMQDFGNLNTALFGNGSKQFNNYIDQIGLGFTIHDDHVYTTFDYLFSLPQSIKIGAQRSRLNGFVVSESVGYSIHLSKWVTLNPYINFGFRKIKLSLDNDTGTIVNSAFSGIKHVSYINNSLFFGPGIDLRFMIANYFGLTFRSNYTFDFSSPYWRLNTGWINKRDTYSPKTNQNALNFSVALNFYSFD
jgi:hypothetical protein